MLSKCGADYNTTHTHIHHHHAAATTTTTAINSSNINSSSACIIAGCNDHKVHLYVEAVTAVAREAQAGQRPADVPSVVHLQTALQGVGGRHVQRRQLLHVQIRDSQPLRTQQLQPRICSLMSKRQWRQ